MGRGSIRRRPRLAAGSRTRVDSGLGRNRPSRTVQTEGVDGGKVRTQEVGPVVGLLDGMEACNKVAKDSE